MINLFQRIAGPYLNSSRNHNLCSLCRPLFIGSRKDKVLGVPATEILPQTVRQLEHAAAHGCDLCRLRWSQLSSEERCDLQGCDKITYGFWQSRVGDGVVFEYWLDSWERGLKPRVSRSVKLKKRSELLLPTAGDLDAGSSTSSREALATAQQWIRDCDQKHNDCRRWIRPDPAFLPTRLIKIDAEPSGKPLLCQGENLPPGTQYIVLSHCWGGEVPLQLKQANLSRFQAGITDVFPKTFSDTMEVVRSLGKQYVWIDSLCIIQDSPEDWEREASLMQRIYENAWCSVAATMAKNSSEGLFSTRNPASVRPVAVEAVWHSILPEKYILGDLNLFTTQIDGAPLVRRGWVVQERVLAPRILHFAQGEIFWECCSLRACETFPFGLPDNTSYKPSMETKHLLTELIPFRTPALQLFALWQAHVNMYSGCGLTKPDKDKLLAISGVARKVGRAEDYAAGLWKSVMVDQLRWSAADGCSRPTTWRAPSWSWTSIDGKVFADCPSEPNLARSTETVCTVHEIDVKPATADPFGPVLPGASLTLEAPLLKAIISITENQFGYPVYWMNNITGRANLDTRSLQAGETVFCMPLTVNTDPASGAIYGILLKPAGQTGKFERDGTFFMSSMNVFDQWKLNANQAFSEAINSDEIGSPLGNIVGLSWKRYAITLI